MQIAITQYGKETEFVKGTFSGKTKVYGTTVEVIITNRQFATLRK